MDDIERIDDLQLQHSAAFDAVPEYAGLKRPKHHFCAHLARDIWLYGPPRGYWCFRAVKRGPMHMCMWIPAKEAWEVVRFVCAANEKLPTCLRPLPQE